MENLSAKKCNEFQKFLQISKLCRSNEFGNRIIAKKVCRYDKYFINHTVATLTASF